MKGPVNGSVKMTTENTTNIRLH